MQEQTSSDAGGNRLYGIVVAIVFVFLIAVGAWFGHTGFNNQDKQAQKPVVAPQPGKPK